MNGESVFGGLMILLLVVVGLVWVGLWLWSLIHCVTNKRLSDANRIIGVVLIVVLGLVGSLIYLFLPREELPENGSGRFAGG